MYMVWYSPNRQSAALKHSLSSLFVTFDTFTRNSLFGHAPCLPRNIPVIAVDFNSAVFSDFVATLQDLS